MSSLLSNLVLDELDRELERRGDFKFEKRDKRRIHQTPGATEVQACIPWLEAEVELVAPKSLVCFGSTAARAIIASKVRISEDRGRVFETRFAAWTMPTYHPSAALRAPEELRRKNREALLEDLSLAAERLREIETRTNARERSSQ